MDELSNSGQQTQIMFIMIISLVIICFAIVVFYVFGEKRKEQKYNSYMESDKKFVKINKVLENNDNNNSYMESDNKFVKINKVVENNDNNNISKNLSTLKNVNEKGVEKYASNSEQVYNISSNTYTYEDAKSVCKAHNGRLAKLDEVINAYKNGGDWCNYGWTEGQLALYPTQQKSWDILQKGDEQHRNDCGLVGVNGGYFQNKDMLFGSNCYGKKPRIKPQERIKQELTNNDSKVKEYQSKLKDIKISPFNKDKWSQNQ